MNHVLSYNFDEIEYTVRQEIHATSARLNGALQDLRAAIAPLQEVAIENRKEQATKYPNSYHLRIYLHPYQHQNPQHQTRPHDDRPTHRSQKQQTHPDHRIAPSQPAPNPVLDTRSH